MSEGESKETGRPGARDQGVGQEARDIKARSFCKVFELEDSQFLRLLGEEKINLVWTKNLRKG